jgi:hypothetical protein
MGTRGWRPGNMYKKGRCCSEVSIKVKTIIIVELRTNIIMRN